MTKLTAEIAREFLDYNPETGKLYWKPRDESIFADTGNGQKENANTWNTLYAGKEALTALNGEGYLHGGILGRAYKAHRVIWLLTFGEWPSGDIDHINGDKTDNRIINLREVSKQQNSRNASRRSDNTSGAVGVSWSKTRTKWRAQIRISGRLVHLGYYRDYERAVAARKSAEQEYGFHKNHGRN